MAEPKELARISERRRALLAESDNLRQQVAMELNELERAAAWVEKGYSVAASLRTWWPVAAAGAGVFLGMGRGGLLAKLGKVWSLWRIARKGLGLWRQYVGSQAAP